MFSGELRPIEINRIFPVTSQGKGAAKVAPISCAIRRKPEQLSIQYWPVARLKPYERNARTHSDEQIVKIAESIKRFGFTSPILVSTTNTIIAGHGRLSAAMLLGMDTVPVIIVGSEWTDDELRSYILADNQLALEAGWDEDLLRLEIGELRDAGFDLALTGFGSSAIAELLDVRLDTEADPEAAPSAPENAVSRRCDLWRLGRHQLMCGDATNADDVRRLLGDAVPLLMVTDPPYGVNYKADWRRTKRKANGVLISSGGAGRAVGEVANDDRADWRDAWALFPGDVAYVWHADRGSRQVVESLEACRFEIRNLIVWVKDTFVLSMCGDYHHQHEACWYAVRKGKRGRWVGGRKQSTRWDIPRPPKSETGHSTQKPVECMKRPIENNSKPGESVYDPFVGSGTTLIAAELSGRQCFAMELNPAYVDVVIQRWQQVTGEQATLVDSGRTFSEVASDRSVEQVQSEDTEQDAEHERQGDREV